MSASASTKDSPTTVGVLRPSFPTVLAALPPCTSDENAVVSPDRVCELTPDHP